MTAADAGATAPTGWAAMRPVWGGANFTNLTTPTSRHASGFINLLDTWSPLIIVAGDPGTYGTVDNFTAQIAAAPLSVAPNFSHVEFTW